MKDDGESISEQVTGGTQKRLLTVAASRPWRSSQGSAAPGLPGRVQGYPKRGVVSTGVFDVNDSAPAGAPYLFCYSWQMGFVFDRKFDYNYWKDLA
jgi:hypothetical protein